LERFKTKVQRNTRRKKKRLLNSKESLMSMKIPSSKRKKKLLELENYKRDKMRLTA
jgi:hypothetical protein